MIKKWTGILIPHLLAVVVFLSVAVIYCRPAFEGRVLVQEDVTQWRAMAQNSFQYKERHGHFPLWTNGMFSGMPAYLIAMDGAAFAPQYFFLDILTLGLKKPAAFFFLACICFYFLTQALRVQSYIGIIGGLAYAYATYNPVIIAVGHDTKMQAIALMPAFIAGLVLIYERKYWRGAAVTTLFTALLVAVNHLQIFYYGLIVAAVMTLGYLVRWVWRRDFRHLLAAGALAAACVVTGVLCNAVLIFITADFAKATIRGGSELAGSGGMTTRNGLSEDYAFSYSLYRSEPFSLLAPKIFGGSSGAELSEDNSKALAAVEAMPPQLGQQFQRYVNFYWGGIGDTAGPAYAGAIICCLALLGLFVLDNKHKWWIAAGCLIAILMSWGGYFPEFNRILLKVLPMYNKFRAPSVILVIPVLLLNVLAMLSLQRIWEGEPAGREGEPTTGKTAGLGDLTGQPIDGQTDGRTDSQTDGRTDSQTDGRVDGQTDWRVDGQTGGKTDGLWKRYKKGVCLIAGVFILLLLLYGSFDYTTGEERQLQQQVSTQGGEVATYGQAFLKGLRDDRQALFLHSLERSLLYILAVVLLTGFFIKGRVRGWIFLGLTGLLAFVDIIGIDVQYLNSDNYKDAAEAPLIPAPSAADKQILRDTGTYRVLDLRPGLGTALTYGAPAAWWHHSIGGYNPAKLSIYQDLIDHQLGNYPQCKPVIDMLNTKYIIQRSEGDGDTVLVNEGALGAAWFVRGVQYMGDSRAVMNALTGFDPMDTAIVLEKDRKLAGVDPQPDSGGRILLVSHDNDEIVYRTDSKTRQFAVFSEVYYDRGWKAYLDGKAKASVAGDPAGQTGKATGETSTGVRENDGKTAASRENGTELPIVRTDYVLRGVPVPAGKHEIRMIFRPDSYYWGQRVQWVTGVLLVMLLVGAVVVGEKKFYGIGKIN